MPADLFDQLSELEVPPAPPQFDHQLHERVNRSLAIQQMLDFALRAVPVATLEFSSAVVGLLTFSITGKYPGKKK